MPSGYLPSAIFATVRGYVEGAVRSCAWQWNTHRMGARFSVVNYTLGREKESKRADTTEERRIIEQPFFDLTKRVAELHRQQHHDNQTGTPKGWCSAQGELTGFSPRIDRIFPSSTSKRYLKGWGLGFRAENLGLG